MQKKSTVLLTVITTMTLLVVTLQSTFAYFAATVSTTGTAASTISTANVASATMALGDAITGSGVNPGWKGLKTLTLTGSGGGTSIKTRLTLTPSVANFGSHIKYSVYKVATADITTKAVTCTASKPTTAVSGSSIQYTDAMTCDTSKAGEAVKTGTFSGTTPVTVDITVTNSTKDTYYVLVEYVNDSTASQNGEMGKSFSVTLSYSPLAS